MTRSTVNSSNVHSIGWDQTGQEVQYHAKTCALRGIAGHASTCNCKGGDVWHYPGVPAEVHLRVIGAPSVGSAFHEHVKAAKHPSTGGLRYPGVLRKDPDA